MSHRLLTAGILSLALAACGPGATFDAPSTTTAATTAPAIVAPNSAQLLFVGDVMLGRGVASLAREEARDVFEGVADVVRAADLATANLESPLTDAPPVGNPRYDLRAEARAADLLAEAGFDLVSLANNHSDDSGRQGVVDTLDAVEESGMRGMGAESEAEGAVDPVVSVVNGVRVGFLAFDTSDLGKERDAGLVDTWGAEAMRAIEGAAGVVDIVVVGLHGSAAYVDHDPVLERAAKTAVELGADVVWSHGAHVQLPTVLTGRSVVATGLGNFLFDQSLPGTRQGTILEVLVDMDGVVAWRTGDAEHLTGRVRFLGWSEPRSDAVLVDGEWWNLVDAVDLAAADLELDSFPYGDVTAADLGDVDLDGVDDLVVSFRRPFRQTLLNREDPARWQDGLGRSAHVGVFRTTDFGSKWIAGTLARPIAGLAACDGGLAVAYDALDDPTVEGGGGWEWSGFGFVGDIDLPGAAVPGCIDVDGDGRTEPVLAR